MKHYSSRLEVILRYCREKKVLDIGSTGQTEAYNLWQFLKKVGSSVCGIDIVPSPDPGIILGDMETYNFNDDYDVIVAGDVIEHVENQGRFLRNVHRHLRADGHFIVTTPNAKWLTVFFKPNPTHALWHDRHTLAYVLEQNGFRVIEFGHYFGNKPRYRWWFWPLVLRQGLIAICIKA